MLSTKVFTSICFPVCNIKCIVTRIQATHLFPSVSINLLKPSDHFLYSTTSFDTKKFLYVTHIVFMCCVRVSEKKNREFYLIQH